MNGHQSVGEAEPPGPPKPAEPANTDRRKTGLDDPRALDILTTEHWSLLSTRTLGYQEMFGRITIFVAILSGTVVALALLAQATHFRRRGGAELGSCRRAGEWWGRSSALGRPWVRPSGLASRSCRRRFMSGTR